MTGSWISRRGTIREDTAIGIVFTGLFALGIVMISATKSFRDVTSLLLGNVLAVTETDLAMIREGGELYRGYAKTFLSDAVKLVAP